MAEVPDHLVPIPGISRSKISFVGIDLIPNNAAGNFRFEITDDDGAHVGIFVITVSPTPEKTVDAMLVEAHRRMTDIARQWVYWLDKQRLEWIAPMAPASPESR